MIALKRPEQKVDQGPKDAPIPLAFTLTKPCRRRQRFVWVAADQRIDELVNGDEDIEHIAHGLQQIGSDKQVVNL